MNTRISSLTHCKHYLSAFAISVVIVASAWQDANAERYIPNLTGRLSTLERDVARLERALEGNGVSSPPTTSSPASLPAIQVELSRLQEEMRNIRGGIEENRFAIDQLQREVRLAAEDNDYRLQTLEEKTGIAMPIGDMGQSGTIPIQSQSSAKTTQPAPIIMQNGRSVVAAPVQTPAAQPIPPQVKESRPAMSFSQPREHYNFAVSLIKEKRFDRARDSFKRFITNHPSDELIGNAYYWLGETYYVNNDFLTAADTFRQGFEVKPNGIKAPDNLYKLAKSLLHIDKKQDACVVLKQIQRRYNQTNLEVSGLAQETERANNCQP